MAEKSMIERVAKALASVDNGAPTTWRMYADDAKVAIRAMRSLSPVVREAGEREAAHAFTPGAPVDLMWKAMIDAALAEPT